MGVSPVRVLVIITLVTVFNAALIGSTATQSPFPEFEQPDGILDALIGIVGAIWGVVTLIYDSVTFNIAGAPFYIRFPLATAMGGSLIWSISALIRGSGA